MKYWLLRSASHPEHLATRARPAERTNHYNWTMYIIAIAWMYVVIIVAVSDTTVIGGILTFLFWGLAPLALFLWLFGTPARRRRAAERTQGDDTRTNDGDESDPDR